ncbi:MAG TPA: amylo-alpha-1,6-glucosidase [Chloroflexota bacterium]|nr:amylo-alpha-1,6-glucosidase [Chloroflexota bacterium]
MTKPASGISRPDQMLPAFRAITLNRQQLRGRGFLLGNGAGMVLHSPVEVNAGARTMLPSKWFGYSGAGFKYLESQRVWVRRAGRMTLLSRADQTSFEQGLIDAVRTFDVDGVTIRQRFFVPQEMNGFVIVLEADRPLEFMVEPLFDMRRYQDFNTAFDCYSADVTDSDAGPILSAWNHIDGNDGPVLALHASVRTAGSVARMQLLPEEERLVEHSYLKDEHREKLIHSAYAETQEQSPDEAPSWDSYATKVYAPCRIIVEGPATLTYGFGFDGETASRTAAQLTKDSGDRFRRAEESGSAFLSRALFQTGDAQIDLAYGHVASRFNQTLVVRNGPVANGAHGPDTVTGILAGDKYFLDAWKRDENISLEALMLANDYATVRDILDSTWQFQDARTGRLPHIVQPGRPLVYYSSDGTLWALLRLQQYTRLTGDRSLLHAKLSMVERFFEASFKTVRRGLLPSGGTIEKSYLWETWEDTAYTPRDGYPVEIELLWLNALRNYLPDIRGSRADLAGRMEAELERGMNTFQTFFLDGYLADSLDYDFRPRDRLTPNGYIAFTLDHPIPEALARQMVVTAREQLAGRVGVKSLAPRDWPKVFRREFLDDPRNIRGGDLASVGTYNYHRGVEWPWLNHFLVAGELRFGNADTAFKTYVQGQVRSVLHHSGVGGLDELTDIHGPLGADFQAWSMAGFMACLHQFAGIEIDAPAKTISVRPCVPDTWPELMVRRRIASHTFDVTVRSQPSGPHVITVDPSPELPQGHMVRVGTPMGARQDVRTVALNGESQTLDRVSAGHGVAGASEAWIEAPLHKGLTVEFGL